MSFRVLVATSAGPLQDRLSLLLPALDVGVTIVGDSQRMWAELHQGDVDLLLVERRLLPGAAAREWVASVRKLPEQTEVVVLTAREDAAGRADLLAAGCLAVLNTGLGDDVLAAALGAVVERRRRERLSLLRGPDALQLSSLQDFVSRSPAMQQFMAVARRVVASDSSLLLLGETGVGKERLARAIHHEGPRRDGPVRGRQLRGPARDAARERAVRSRAGRVHRRHARATRLLRAGRGRHHLPRRDRRDAAATCR